MRGKQGEKLTLVGDWLYDWSKLYQSLIGYDRILMDKEIDKKNENEIISYFEEYFMKLFGREKLKDLKMITRSLLFTLIPLHDNDKCIEYYNLINLIK